MTKMCQFVYTMDTRAQTPGHDEASRRGKKMHELIEIELTRVRRMAEQVDDRFLLYLIDMAILEVHRKARSSKDSLERHIIKSIEHDAPQGDD